MKQSILFSSLMVALVMMLGSTTFAGKYDEFIHFVNHRDANGNLVVPTSPKVSVMPEPSSIEPTPAATTKTNTEGSYQTPEQPQSVSQDHESFQAQHETEITEPSSESAPTETHTLHQSESLQEPVLSEEHAPMFDEMHAEQAPSTDQVPSPSEFSVPISENAQLSPFSTVGSENEPSQPPYSELETPVGPESPEESASEGNAPFAEVPLSPAYSELEDPSNVETSGVMKQTRLPSQPQSFAFRSTNWGMTIPEVKTKETAEYSWELNAPILLAGEHRLGYRTQVEGIESFLTYAFENDRLMKVKYLFETSDADDNEAQSLVNYKKIKNWIVESYGPPQSEEKLWVNELYRYAPELWGRALKRGHLTIVDEWDVEGTSIMLFLNGGDEDVGLVAEFSTTTHTTPTELVHIPNTFFDL